MILHKDMATWREDLGERLDDTMHSVLQLV
jgi:hypothetical protein